MVNLLLFTWSCSAPEDENEKTGTSKEEKVAEALTKKAPEKITFLFVTQATCPSCDKLKETMKLEAPKRLLSNYFDVKKILLGDKLPEGLTPPNGTPTVYFLGTDNEVLVEPMIGEKTQAALMEFLEDALLEYKNTYKIDLTTKTKKEENNAPTP